MIDTMDLVMLVLSVAATTLAIAASVFSWVTFRNTSQMQVQAQATLAKVSEKVEVVVAHTTHQMDKAWDYLTGRPALLGEAAEEAEKKMQELVEEARREARQAALQVVEEAGLKKDQMESLVSRMESVAAESAERARTLVAYQQLLDAVVTIEAEVRSRAKAEGMAIPASCNWKDAKDVVERVIGHPKATADFLMLVELRDSVVHGPGSVSETDVRGSLGLASKLLDYLRQTRRP